MDYAQFPEDYRLGSMRECLVEMAKENLLKSPEYQALQTSLNAEEEVRLLRARVHELEAGLTKAADLCYALPGDHRPRTHHIAEHCQDVLASDVRPFDLAYALKIAGEALDAAGWPESAGVVALLPGDSLSRSQLVHNLAERIRASV